MIMLMPMYQNYVFLLELFWEFDLLELIHMAEILLLKPESINQSINQLINQSINQLNLTKAAKYNDK
mgnify:CR=1 FL=1